MLTTVSYYAFEGLVPVAHSTVFVHPNAVLIGGVITGADVYIGPLALLHGDHRRSIVQAEANTQEDCIMYGYCDADTIVGENGHIEHRAILHGCMIGHDALIGVNNVIVDGAVIDEEGIVVAISSVKAGFRGEKCQLLTDTPARAVCDVSDDELYWKWLNIREYQDLVGCYHASLHGTQPLRQMGENRSRLQGTTDVTPKR